VEGLTVKSFFDFIGRTEVEKYSRLPRNAETGDSDKEALFASAGGVEVSEFLGGDTRQFEKRRHCQTPTSVGGPDSEVVL
jgi:hypothetical protein